MISVKSLRVDYDTVTAVEDLDLEVGPGEIFGLLGPNGAWKTSTIKAVARAIEPTYGEIRIDGVDPDVHPEEAWRRIGYMPDTPPLYPNLTVREYLDVFAAAHLVARPGRADRVRDWAVRVDLEKKLDTRVSELSRGMKQRLVLAKTLLPEPKALLLDEPASGMDPIARVEMRRLLHEAAANGAAVVISSHILSELDELCTAVGVMEKGRMVVSGSIADIRRRLETGVRLRVRPAGATSAEAVAAWLEGHPLVSGPAVAAGQCLAEFHGTEDQAAELLSALVGAGLTVAEFALEHESLESLFMRIGARETS